VVDRRGSKCVDKSMQSNWSPAASRSAYFARQIPRLLWYVGHAYVMSRLAENARKQRPATANDRQTAQARRFQTGSGFTATWRLSFARTSPMLRPVFILCPEIVTGRC